MLPCKDDPFYEAHLEQMRKFQKAFDNDARAKGVDPYQYVVKLIRVKGEFRRA